MSQDGLLSAARRGDLNRVRELHQSGIDIRADDDAALDAAAAAGSLPLVQYLHRSGAEISARGDAAVLAAARHGQLQVLRYLHQMGGAIRAQDDAPMIAAAAAGHLDVVRYLHNAGAPIDARDDSPAIAAAAGGHLGVLTYLHEAGASLRAQDDAAIVAAAANGHLEIVRELHCLGVPIRARNDAALLAAAANGHLKIVRYLEQNGVALAEAGHAALIEACTHGQIEVVRHLHRSGVDPRANRSAALGAAIAHGSEEVVRYLRQSGCPEPGAEPSLPPALSSAERFYWNMVLPAVAGQLERMALLYENGVLGDGAEAAVIAAANGQLDVLRHLHTSGCPLGAIAEAALLSASSNGRLEVLDYLHANGADLKRLGPSAIAKAAEKGHLDVVRFLHRSGVGLDACASVAERLARNPSHLELVSYLAEHGVFPAGPALSRLIQAIGSRDPLAVRERLAQVDLKAHSAALAGALARNGDVALCALLRQNGFDIRADDDLALRLAAEHGHIALVRSLHENGADIHACDEEALRAAATAGHLNVVAYLHGCGAEVARIDPETLTLVRLSGHAEVFDFLTTAGADAIARDRGTIEAMRAELYAAKPVYRPSKLWEFFNEVNMEQLRLGGLHAFKRSINQNYFNFIPYSPLDPQLRNLTAWWLRHPTLTPFKLRLADPDRTYATKQLVRVDSRVFTLARGQSAISTLSKRIGVDFARTALLLLYRGLVSTLWDFVRAHDKLGLTARFTEPRLGTPIAAYLDGRMISQDLAHSIMEFNSIFGEIAPDRRGPRMRIAEVGAGYGRLAHVIAQSVRCQYVVIDIPPGLYVSQWYLSRLFGTRKVFAYRHFERFEDVAAELEQADIAFLCANQIELLPPGYFDLTINISSLHELRPDQISHMLDEIYRITRSYVYLKQYKEYLNPYDGLRILEDSYKLAPGWKHRYYRDDAVDPRFFETLIESTKAPPSAQTCSAPKPGAGADAPQPSSHKSTSVSILLANYNHAQYLPTSLSGICGQTRPADEIIVVDDGSTDDSIEVIERYAARFGNIRLLTNGRNRGQHYSIQRALAAATSEYVVWASSDDLLLPRFLEHSLDALARNPEAGLCFSRLAVFVDGSKETREYTGQSHGAAFEYGNTVRYLAPDELSDILRRHYLWISGNTVVARRAALLEMGGMERDLRWHADWFAFYAVALRYGACMIPETLALMRERPGTYSAGGTADLHQQRQVLTAIFDAIKSQKYLDIGRTFRRRPALLSLFGKRALLAALRSPRHWDFAVSIALWLGPRYLHMKYGRLRAWLSARLHA